MKKEISLVITLDKMKLISVNQLYHAGLIFRGGKQVPYIYKDASAKKFEAILDDQLRAVDFSDHVGWISETKQFTVTQQYILKSGINRRDCGNMEKCASDCIVRFFRNDLGLKNFDDSQFSDVHLYKSYIPGSQHEYLCIKISPSTFNMRFDQIQKPEQALVHIKQGEDLGWEKAFKKRAKEVGIKYQLSTTDKKIKDHNTDIFFLRPIPNGWSTRVMDLMDWIYAHKDSGFTFYGVWETESDEMREQGQQVIDKINSFGISAVKAGWIKSQADVLDLIGDECK